MQQVLQKSHHKRNTDEHTEELLSIHENEIHRLKDERRVKAPLLASIKRYFEICDEEKELAAAASDQSRLLGRGPRDPGRLLREEKMRKRVGKEKPRVRLLPINISPLFHDGLHVPSLYLYSSKTIYWLQYLPGRKSMGLPSL